MGLRYDARTDQPDVPVVSGRFWIGVRNGLLASAFGWAVIFGLGWLGYRIGQLV